ncbi:hypothetical protein [Kitasatospora sp. NPDC056181]|uniref:hypothetical protein n=1 Tax=Kitasatospora sp. NPDC056181 TaxID=3345737 RepID=UPI0035DC8E29
MRRRAFVGMCVGVVGALATGLVWSVRSAEAEVETEAEAAETAERKVQTGLEPPKLRRSLEKLGPVATAHWVEESTGTGSRAPGPSDFFLQAFLTLAPGGVARLLDGHQTTAVSLPPVRTAAEAMNHWDEIPAALAAYAPSGASWVGSEVLTSNLVRAGDATLCFDRASDTVYLKTINLHVPDVS